MGIEAAETGYHIDGRLKKNWTSLSKKLIERDEDKVYVIAGLERVGKSLWTIQQACFIDKNFNLDRICFTPEEFLKQIRVAPKGSCIIFDEAFRGLSSRGALSKVNKMLIQALMEVGQRNLCVFIVLPSFFMLDSYIAKHRNNGLFYIHRDKHGKRGFWRYFDIEKCRLLLKLGRDTHSYNQPFTPIRGKFFGKYPAQIDEAAYRKKKLDSLKDSGEGDSTRGNAARTAIYNTYAPYWIDFLSRTLLQIHYRNGKHFDKTLELLKKEIRVEIDIVTLRDWIDDAKKKLKAKEDLRYYPKEIKNKADGIDIAADDDE